MTNKRITDIIKGVIPKTSRHITTYSDLPKDSETALLEYANYREKHKKGKIDREIVLFGKLRKIFSEELKIKSANELTENHLVSWVNELIDIKQMKYSTVRGRVADVVLYLHWYFKKYKKYKDYNNYYLPLKEALEDINLKDATNKYHGAEDDIKRITWAQVNELSDYCNPKMKALMEFLLNTGFRISEALSINIQDITTIETNEGIFLKTKKDKKESNLRDSIELFKCKNSLIRWLSIHPFITKDDMEDLKHGKFPIKNNNPLWCTSKGHRLKPISVWTKLRDLGIKAQYKDDINPHVFRHGFGFWRKLVCKIPSEQLKVEMGHRSIKTTMDVYGKATVEDYTLNGRGGEAPEEDKESKEIQYCINCGEESASYFKLCPSCGTALNEEGKKIEEERTKTLTDGFKKEINELRGKIEQVKELITTSIAFVDTIGDDEIIRLKKLNREQSE